jgi:transcription termination factor Rho
MSTRPDRSGPSLDVGPNSALSGQGSLDSQGESEAGQLSSDSNFRSPVGASQPEIPGSSASSPSDQPGAGAGSASSAGYTHNRIDVPQDSADAPSGNSECRPPASSAGNRQRIKQQIRERTRQLNRQGPPVSFSERASIQEVRPVEEAQSQETVLPIKILQQLTVAEIRAHVQPEGIELPEDLSRRELLLRIIRHRIKAKGLMYGEGTLQILPDGFGFLRSMDAHYLSCPDDIYVSPSQIRKFNLRTGCTVCGQVRPPKGNERFFALLRVELVNGRTPDVHSRSKSFEHLTPLHPDRRIVMEHDPEELSTRLVDLLAPIGFGQRGLIASPPRAGKTILLQQMARAVLKNHPDSYIILLLVDERPEEVTDMVREVRSDRCEVISSTFDESPSRHIQVAEMVLEKCKCLVETGVDVVLFLDSITRLTRAWNAECPPSGRLLSGGLDANALQKPKALFGAARKLEEGGSLTIIATALIQTGSQLDEVIYEEFKGTGNLEILLDRNLVERRIWPAFDLSGSGTRREEKLFDGEEYAQVCQLRRELASLQANDALEQLLERLRKTRTNAEFLLRLKSGQS